jgi:hypothetical protein
MVSWPNGEIAALDKHRESHRPLFRFIELLIDAVVVPASWPVQQLLVAVKTIETLGAQLAVLCSRDAKSADFSRWIGGRPGLWWQTIDNSDRYRHSWLDFMTSEVTKAKVERLGDPSLKGNLGVLLARMWGWHSVPFLYNDVNEVEEAAV